MRNLELHQQYQRILHIIESSKSNVDNIQLQGHLGMYVCVLASGFLENALCELYASFASKAASPQVATYARHALSKIQNPKAAKFIETAKQFNPEWGDSLKKFLESDISRQEAIDAIIQNRHLIAHGKNTSISLGRVKDLLKKSVEVLEFIEEHHVRV